MNMMMMMMTAAMASELQQRLLSATVSM